MSISSPTEPVTCRKCRHGVMRPFAHVETYQPPNAAAVQVRQWAARCDHCSKETVLASQIDENLRLRAERQRHYGEYLLGEDIYGFRRRWGLTQQQFSKIFGRGLIAFSRFEAEKAYPDLTLTRLLRVCMRHPGIFKELAENARVVLPFWESYCAAERSLRLRFIQRVADGSAAASECDKGERRLDTSAMPLPLSPDFLKAA